MIAIIPMAGLGTRVKKEFPDSPKPLIPLNGKPVFEYALQYVLDNISSFSKVVVIVLEEHVKNYKIDEVVKKYFKEKATILVIPKPTNGQLETVLKADKYLNTKEGVLIGNADTVINDDIIKTIQNKPKNVEGIISVIEADGDNWSFTKLDKNELVTEVAEKKRISNWCSTGLYYFDNASTFLKVGTSLIKKGEKTKGEYYVIPVYQKYIYEEKKISISKALKFIDLGNPVVIKSLLKPMNNE